MDYFRLRQDRRYLNTPIIEGFYQTMRRKDFTKEYSFKIPERNIVYCDTEKEQEFIDILDGQLFLASREVRHVFQMYEKSINYKFFCFLNNVTGAYANYYAPVFPSIACLEEGKANDRDQLKIRKENIGSASIFRIEDAEKEVIVIRLDVAESLLRRKLSGFELENLILT